ncbi:hypothetical protein M5K25_014713 [Dendrobium thyrsiflorum]|uniref:LOB domain-containing protein n=1 Tax=Dendrobium thyrsiflorum TaxID=117978 RepID=A0ABD0UNW8_DENTH
MLPSANKKKAKAKAKAKPAPATATDAGNSSSSLTAPCGACKFLRRKCVSGCVFAAHFGSEQGAPARFAAVHKVFGSSNVSKLLKLVPPAHRHDTVFTVVQLQSELSIVQSQLINRKLAVAEAFQFSQTQQQLMMTVQPAYSNSSVFNNLNVFSNFPSSGLDFCDSQSLELLQLSQTIQNDGDEVEDITDEYPEAFSDGILQPKEQSH